MIIFSCRGASASYPKDEKMIVAESSICRQQDAKEHDASPDAYLGISQPRLQQTYIKSYEL